MGDKMWFVRAGEKGYMFEEFIQKSVVAIGWIKIGDLSSENTLNELKKIVREKYPEYKDGAVNIAAGQIFRFRNAFQKDDQVVTYNPESRYYHIGRIVSDYEYNETLLDKMKHIRKVEWGGKILRDVLSPSARNTLGSIMTIIKVPSEVKNEINELLKSNGKRKIDDTDEASEEYDFEAIKEDVIAKAHEFIKDKILTLDWEEMEELIAGILRSMGYKTRITPKGPDMGRDILASPDGLGLEEPRIIAEVKHRTAQIGSSDIRSFTGGLRGRDKGIYVSTGGFTKEAKYEAERSNMPIAIIDSDGLVELITQYYDDFDAQTKSLIPLKKIYWPL
ncbi:MAG: restriction endonuclease [Thermoanaerobacteraceae bacterium]|nr:restriction endonuclease [Thermoanaerobacteraceae bacterium]